MKHYSQVFKPTEVQMMLASFSNMETINVAAYSQLLDTIGMPEVEYQAFLQIKEMRDKYDYMQQFNTNQGRYSKNFGNFGALQKFITFCNLRNITKLSKI